MRSLHRSNLALSLVLGLGASLLLSTSALTQMPLGKHTTFLARFGKSPIPNYCAGDWQAVYSGDVELVKGKFILSLTMPIPSAHATTARS